MLFVYSLRTWPISLFCLLIFNSTAPFIEETSFSIKWSGWHCWKSLNHRCVDLLLDSFLFCWSLCLALWYHHYVFISWCKFWNLEIWVFLFYFSWSCLLLGVSCNFIQNLVSAYLFLDLGFRMHNNSSSGCCSRGQLALTLPSSDSPEATGWGSFARLLSRTSPHLLCPQSLALWFLLKVKSSFLYPFLGSSHTQGSMFWVMNLFLD